MTKKDYVPGNDVQFLEWADKLFTYATTHATRLKAPAPDDGMRDLKNDFEAALAKASNPNRGKVDVLEKNEARKRLEKACRDYAQGFLARNIYVSNVDRERMGLNVRDTTPTPVADPTGQAIGVVSYRGSAQLHMAILHKEDTPLDAKANYGHRIYFDLRAPGATPPASGIELTQSRFTRRKNALFTFLPTDTGKTVYFAIRYENSKGKSGPWGPLFSSLIP